MRAILARTFTPTTRRGADAPHRRIKQIRAGGARWRTARNNGPFSALFRKRKYLRNVTSHTSVRRTMGARRWAFEEGPSRFSLSFRLSRPSPFRPHAFIFLLSFFSLSPSLFLSLCQSPLLFVHTFPYESQMSARVQRESRGRRGKRDFSLSLFFCCFSQRRNEVRRRPLAVAALPIRDCLTLRIRARAT